MITMAEPRIVETNTGIQGDHDVVMYDTMMRRMRDKGWLETALILKSGIREGLALEVGPGPGYLGLEWLKKTERTNLAGLDISAEMLATAGRNADEYGFGDRVRYVQGDARRMPFDDMSFDAVFTNGSLHEWSDPRMVFNELYRVLKPSGRYCISDLRRDMSPLTAWFMKAVTKPKEIRHGLVTSIRAAYTVGEIQSILTSSDIEGFSVKKAVMGLVITGRKTGGL